MTGFPPPRINWFHNGREIPDQSSAVYIIENGTMDHAGNYRCQAVNEYSESSSDVTISFQGMRYTTNNYNCKSPLK